MSHTKRYDTAAIVVSLILGVGFAVLIRFFPVLYRPGYLFAFLLSLTALALETVAASSLLRQDKRLNHCICATGRRLLIPALVLLATALLGYLAGVLGLAVGVVYPVFTFLLYALISFTFFSLYGFLACLIEAGCPACGCGE